MSLLSWASNHFLDPIMVYSYILVVIFLLIYLIRPKPRYQVMPTLMFLFKDMGKSRATNFFRKLLTNLLFLMQLLLIIAIVTAVAKPYISVSKESLFKNTVIVLDTSASMKAPYESTTRFEKAKQMAKDATGSINTLILVKKKPEVALLDESSGKTRDYITKLTATDQPTNLYAAISAAGSYAKPDSRIVVISDFIDTNTDTDLGTIKKTLESQGIKVDFMKLQSDVPNVGIVDLSVSDSKATAVMKNFNAEPVKIRVKINDLSEEMEIAPNSREVFTFTTPPRTSKLEMDVIGGKDNFKGDNEVFISAPSDVKKKVLFITNNPNYAKTYIYNALDVMKGVTIQVTVPPKIPELKGHDIYVFKDVDPSLILPGTFKGVKEEVEKGGKAALIFAQDTSLAIDYQGLMPMTAQSLETKDTNVIATGSDAITEGIEFGITKKYFTMKPIEGKVAVVLAAADEKTPIIAYSKLGAGSVAYYGVLDENKEAEAFFGKSPAYFVFWKRMIDFATNTPSIRNLNYRTGSIITFPKEERIDTPTGKITTKELVLDNQGLYTLQDRVIAINLADELESDLSSDQTISNEAFTAGGERFKEKVPFELTDFFIYAALTLLLLELIYVKFRGDF